MSRIERIDRNEVYCVVGGTINEWRRLRLGEFDCFMVGQTGVQLRVKMSDSTNQEERWDLTAFLAQGLVLR